MLVDAQNECLSLEYCNGLCRELDGLYVELSAYCEQAKVLLPGNVDRIELEDKLVEICTTRDKLKALVQCTVAFSSLNEKNQDYYLHSAGYGLATSGITARRLLMSVLINFADKQHFTLLHLLILSEDVDTIFDLFVKLNKLFDVNVTVDIDDPSYISSLADLSTWHMRLHGYTVTELMLAGYGCYDLQAGGYEAIELKRAKCDLGSIIMAGYPAKDLIDIKITLSDIVHAGAITPSTAPNPKEGNSYYSVSALVSAGCPIEDFKRSGFSATELRSANCNCTAEDLFKSGYMCEEVCMLGIPAAELKAAGYSVPPPVHGGKRYYTVLQLRLGGYTVSDCRNHSGNYEFTVGELYQGGYTCKQLRQAGYTAKQLVGAVPFDQVSAVVGNQLIPNSEILQAKFMPAELCIAKIPCGDVKETELYLTRDILTAGYTVLEYKEAGYSASELRHFLPLCTNANFLAKQKYSLPQLVMLKQWLETNN